MTERVVMIKDKNGWPHDTEMAAIQSDTCRTLHDLMRRQKRNGKRYMRRDEESLYSFADRLSRNDHTLATKLILLLQEHRKEGQS